MQEKKQQLEQGMEQQTVSKFGKEYVKAKYYHPACFNLHAGHIMQNPGLDESQLKSRLPAEISTTSDMQMIPL